MGKFKPIKYNTGEDLAKIKIIEESGSLLETWTIMLSDLGSWFRLMKRKYGNRVDKEKSDEDLSWIR